jgi:hypothetical protein
MNIVTILVTGLIGFLLVAFMLSLFAAMIFNMKVSQKYRAGIAQSMDKLRLNAMLGAVGINTRDYLHNERILEIRNQIKRCKACARTDECDHHLKNGAVQAEALHFCNNGDTLRQMVAQQAAPQQSD